MHQIGLNSERVLTMRSKSTSPVHGSTPSSRLVSLLPYSI